MFKFIGMFILALALTGCATHSPYGNFIDKNEYVNQEKIAIDATDKIIELFPPGKTQFEIKQPTPDLFGVLLIKGLRERGYAVQEFIPNSNLNNNSAVNNNGALPLYYVLDRFTGTNMYRVTINIGSQSITKPYSQELNELVPVGYWIRKE